MAISDLFTRRANNAMNLFNGGFASPFADDSVGLGRVVLSDIFGDVLPDAFPLSRAEAIAIPAVSKARNLLVSVIAPLPLVALDSAGELPIQPTFLYRTDGIVTPYERMAWTIDDLVFYGYSLWAVTRGTSDQILTAEWVPFDAWRIDKGRVLIDDQPVPSNSVILFNSPFEGLLQVATRTLRQARDIETTVASRVRNPWPTTVISATGDDLEDFEIEDLLSQWGLARRQVDGAVGYLPAGLKFEQFGEAKPELFLEARNAIVTNVGQFLNIRSAMLDGTSSVDSLTYVTESGSRNAFVQFDLPFWTDPIAARLSMDDIVPRGQRVRFDLSDLLTSPLPVTGTPTKD